jgi:hypothetical protein
MKTTRSHPSSVLLVRPRPPRRAVIVRRVIRPTLVAALLVSASTGAVAQPPDPVTPSAVPDSPTPATSPGPAAAATFWIEKIVVQGVHHGSERIVVTETLLTLGKAYTEPQLREALHRVERLPFVVNADFSLRRGSERGRYELVISVTEAKPIFFGGEAGASCALYPGYDLSPPPARRRGWDMDCTGSFRPEIGARAFFGGRNELALTLGRSRDPLNSSNILVEGSYRRHDLFGLKAVGTLFLRLPQTEVVEFGGELAVPLDRASALKVTLSRSASRGADELNGFNPDLPLRQTSRFGTNTVAISWQHDTTDDPFTPRHGARLQTALSLSDGSQRSSMNYEPFSTHFVLGDPSDLWRLDQDQRGLAPSLSGTKYWPLGERLSLGTGARFGFSLSDTDGRVSHGSAVQPFTTHSSGASASAQAELLGILPQKGCPFVECWWSARVSLSGSRWKFDLADAPELEGSQRTNVAGVTATLAVAVRGRWGTARLEFSVGRQEITFRSSR